MRMSYFRILFPAILSLFSINLAAEKNESNDSIGIGIEIGTNYRGEIKVYKVAEGSPAESSGIRAGDIIMEIEGKAISIISIEKYKMLGYSAEQISELGKNIITTIDQANNMLKGRIGTKVILKIKTRTEGESNPVVSITRDNNIETTRYQSFSITGALEPVLGMAGGTRDFTINGISKDDFDNSIIGSFSNIIKKCDARLTEANQNHNGLKYLRWGDSIEVPIKYTALELYKSKQYERLLKYLALLGYVEYEKSRNGNPVYKYLTNIPTSILNTNSLRIDLDYLGSKQAMDLQYIDGRLVQIVIPKIYTMGDVDDISPLIEKVENYKSQLSKKYKILSSKTKDISSSPFFRTYTLTTQSSLIEINVKYFKDFSVWGEVKGYKTDVYITDKNVAAKRDEAKSKKDSDL